MSLLLALAKWIAVVVATVAVLAIVVTLGRTLLRSLGDLVAARTRRRVRR